MDSAKRGWTSNGNEQPDNNRAIKDQALPGKCFLKDGRRAMLGFRIFLHEIKLFRQAVSLITLKTGAVSRMRLPWTDD